MSARRFVPEGDPEALHAIGLTRRAINALARSFPYHSALLSRWTVIPTREVDTAGVTLGQADAAGTVGVLLLINPEFFASCSEDNRIGVVHHEANHVLFGHLMTKLTDMPDAAARIVAEEVTVNEWVAAPLPGQPIVLADHPELPPDEDTQTRYARLAKARTSRNAKGAGTAASPKPLDDHEVWAVAAEVGVVGEIAVRDAARGALGALSPAQRAALSQDLLDLIGNTCGVATGANVDTLLGGGSATVDWRGVLRRLLAAQARPEVSFGRPPRRFPQLVGVVPGRVVRDDRLKVLAALDTSGSMDTETIEAIGAELSAVTRFGDVVLVQCDTVIHSVEEFTPPLRQVVGRGGTDLCPPFDPGLLREHRPDVIVYFTDGYGPAPLRPPRVPVYWCLTRHGQRPAPWGRVLKMK